MQKSGGNVRPAGAGLPWCLVPGSEDTWTPPHPRLEPQRHEHPHLSLCLPHIFLSHVLLLPSSSSSIFAGSREVPFCTSSSWHSHRRRKGRGGQEEEKRTLLTSNLSGLTTRGALHGAGGWRTERGGDTLADTEQPCPLANWPGHDDDSRLWGSLRPGLRWHWFSRSLPAPFPKVGS